MILSKVNKKVTEEYLREVKEFINSQLREFSNLNKMAFLKKKLEYPEFAWYEGIVNAVTTVS